MNEEDNMSDIKNILEKASQFQFGPERQFHTMKHFSSIDEAFVKQFLHQYQNIEGIEESLAKNVSKFHPTFANNPFSVIGRLSNPDLYELRHVRENGKRIEIQLGFSPDQFPEGIGWDRIISLEELPGSARTFVKKMDGLLFCNYNVMPSSTWDLNIILEKTDEGYEIITFFPGILAPPLPGKGVQSKSEFERSTKFWTSHVIVKDL